MAEQAPFSPKQFARQGMVGFNERLARGLDELTELWNLTASAWSGDPARVNVDTASKLFGEKSIEAPANDLEKQARNFGRGVNDAALLVGAAAIPGAPAALRGLIDINKAGPGTALAAELLSGGGAAVGADMGGIPGALAGAIAPAAALRSTIPKVASEVAEEVAKAPIRQGGKEVAKAAQPPIPPAQMAAEAVTAPRPEDAAKAVNINLSKIDSPEAIKDAIYNVGETFKGRIDDARRGVITDEAVRGLADDLGMTPEKLLARRKGEAFNAEQVLAARQILVDSATNLQELARKAKGGADTDLSAFREALSRHAAIQGQVSGLTAEAGRALRQFKQAASPGQIKTLIDNFGGRENIEQMADMIADLDPHQVNAFAREAEKATTGEMLVEAWKSALLSSPVTHAVNAMSNTLTMAWTVPEELLAASIGKLRTGNDKVYFREAGARAFGLLQGVKDGLKVAAKTARGEIDQIDDLNKPEIFRAAIPGDAGKVIRIPLKALEVSDSFFKTMGRRADLYGNATNTGIKQGLKGKDLAEYVAKYVQDPPPEAIESAEQFARYITFNKQLGDVGKGIMKIRDAHPALNLVLPFIRTPVNIVKFAVERTPFAKVLKEARDATAKGGASADRATARMLMGGAVGGAVFAEAMDGRITGNGPTDPEARALLRNSGWQPYSFKVGDRYYAYNRLEPLGILLGTAADSAEIWQALNSDEKERLAATIGMAFSKNITSKTWLEGVSGLIEAMNDPDRYGEKYLRSMAGTLIPTSVAHVARIQDPTLRDVQSVVDQLRSRTPGFSASLPARRNIWGDPIVLQGAVGPDWLSPIYSSIEKNDPVMNEMLRLKIYPTLPNRKIGDYEIPPARYWDYVAEAGRPAKQILDAIVTAPEWENLPDVVREETITEIISKTRRAAQLKMRAEIIREQGKEGALKVNPRARKLLESLEKSPP